MDGRFFNGLLPVRVERITGDGQAAQMIDHDLQTGQALGDFGDFIDREIVDEHVEGQPFFRKQAQVPPNRIGKESVSSRAVPHPDTHETGIL